MLIMLLGLALYFGGGLVFNYALHSTLVPFHATFWKQFCGLVADGFGYCRSLLLCSAKTQDSERLKFAAPIGQSKHQRLYEDI